LEAMHNGFQAALNRLDLLKAREDFEKAKGHIYKLEGVLGPGSKYISDCLSRITALEKKVDQMAPVPGNDILFHNDQRVAVESIYIDFYEASNKNFLTFLKQMEPYRRNWKKIEQKYPGMWKDRSRFKRTMRRLDDLEDRQKSELLPVDGVSYYEAIAYLQWRGKDLPTWEEWWLAAKGPADASVPRFPWGDNMAKATEEKELNQFNVPVAVNEGGECHRDKKLHHMAGNMAEWLKVDDVRSSKVGRLVGGSYSLVARVREAQMKLYAGEKCLKAELWKQDEGFGFRGVVRPKAFFKDLLPVKD
ncbi:MAG: SUMF1/EgtB/PvdO family nonheme iron enzyme, partial [Planctomycetota bacterium]